MRRISWKAIGGAAVVAFLVFVGAQVYLAGRENVPLPGSQPVTLRGGHVNGNRISSKSWSFDYVRAQTTPDGSIATVDGVRHGVLYKNGKPYLRVSAQHVQINTSTLDFTATGDVHVEQINPKDRESRSFDTDLVQWTNVTKMLLLPHPSIVRSADQLLHVRTITVDFVKGQIRFGKINGGFHIPA
ncbi:MAG TPA: hypothetical protein VIG51_06215 [Candidatus Baltobacteraceae bacterium]|jgi:hypothetical protein